MKACCTDSHKHHKSPLNSTSEFQLKNDCGVICPQVRVLIRRLASEGVATERIYAVIIAVANGMGAVVIGSISPRSVGRIVLEGLIEAWIQLAYTFNQVDSLSVCGDGTSIKNEQYESRAIIIPPTTTPKVLTFGVDRSPNHTAQSQLEGWISTIDMCCTLFQSSPLGSSMYTGTHTFASKLRGMVSDHASDQKRLFQLLAQWKQKCNREIQGAYALQNQSKEQQLQSLSIQLEHSCKDLETWESLSLEQQGVLVHDAWISLALRIGTEEFQKLSLDKQKDTDFVVWTGCCMHKELNAVKGGATNMANIWDTLGLKSPIALWNKSESEGQHLGTEKTPCGAVKLTLLAGAIFNNRDDKRGYHRLVSNYFEKVYGYTHTFPNTSNTRYGSHCDAAAELIIHLETYIQLFELIHNGKTGYKLTNIEKNVFHGIQDKATLAELATLAAYSQSISHPYMSYVRSTPRNALDLGDFHCHVKEHCRAVIKNPYLLIGSDATAETGALTGVVWGRPDVMHRVIHLSKSLPGLKDCVQAFFEGALTAWERFTSEFAPGGSIDEATPAQLSCVWNLPTNDVSEGALGQCRQMNRKAPTMSDNQRNGRYMWRNNDTAEWADRMLTEVDRDFIRKEARALDARGDSKRISLELNNAMEEKAKKGAENQARAQKKQSQRTQKLAGVIVLSGVTQADLSKLTVQELDAQIDKLRETDKDLKPKSTLRNKQAKVDGVYQALKRREAQPNLYLPFEDTENMDTNGAMGALSPPRGQAPEDDEMFSEFSH
ncbi:hypothetical protein B0J17DRAFT_584920 [Rhizoctonia solani]|nr:hypothetical protein B0J17DRAFT_584920 [Rhizoctonia solani]